MLRKDTLHMLKSDWEPKVPSVKDMKKQVLNAQGRIAGNVRFALGRVTVGNIKK